MNWLSPLRSLNLDDKLKQAEKNLSANKAKLEHALAVKNNYPHLVVVLKWLDSFMKEMVKSDWSLGWKNSIERITLLTQIEMMRKNIAELSHVIEKYRSKDALIQINESLTEAETNAKNVSMREFWWDAKVDEWVDIKIKLEAVMGILDMHDGDSLEFGKIDHVIDKMREEFALNPETIVALEDTGRELFGELQKLESKDLFNQYWNYKDNTSKGSISTKNDDSYVWEEQENTKYKRKNKRKKDKKKKRKGKKDKWK